MQVEFTIFGKTRIVRCEPHNMEEDETPDKILWVERGEDMYALSSPEFKGKKVAIVNRNDWLKVSR